jgi:lipoate-protein ligase B
MNDIRITKYERRTLSIYDCELADYRKVLNQQHQLHEERRQDKTPDTILIVEHPPVITLGARTSANKLLAAKEELLQKGIDVVPVRRGGGTTAHNPGQLVFYPILKLQELGFSINEYIRILEEIGIELLAQLGVNAQRQKGFPGLWVENNRQSSIVPHPSRKIASIGVRVSKGVTYHGMAININNDLSIFDLFVPCGLNGVQMTSVLKETGQEQSMAEVKNKLKTLLCAHFGKTEDR